MSDMRQSFRVEVGGRARPLTVGDLKAIIAQADASDDLHVKVWSDAEGNQINHLLEVQVGGHTLELVPFD